MEVKIIRSKRRRRTVSARVLKDLLVVSAPFSLSEARLEGIISEFKSKFERRKRKEELNRGNYLVERSAYFNQKYFSGALTVASIAYVDNQTAKFGCCNYANGAIRISHRIGSMPDWVKDYVIMHEMAHLVEPNHGKEFWEIVNRYPLTERARGYLIAVGLEGL